MATKLDKDAKARRNAPGFGNARVITADEYFKRVRQGPVRGCKWDGDEMMSLLNELGKDPLRHAERRLPECGLLVDATFARQDHVARHQPLVEVDEPHDDLDP